MKSFSIIPAHNKKTILICRNKIWELFYSIFNIRLFNNYEKVKRFFNRYSLLLGMGKTVSVLKNSLMAAGWKPEKQQSYPYLGVELVVYTKVNKI